jgi:hypothetical protein
MTLNNVLIQEITLTQAASLVTFSNISQEYTDLRIVASMRDSGDDLVRFSMGFNSTSKTTTTRKILYADGSSVSSTTGSTNTSVGYGSTRSTGTANTFGNAEIYIPNYTSSNYKVFSVDATEENNHAVNSLRSMTAGVWESTAAITSLSIICDAPNFAAGSSFTLYGISKLGVTPTVYPKATGGDIIKNDGTYWYHAFLSTGAFIPSQALTADVLVVAGGGGSHPEGSGGGGAGGLLGFTNQALTSGTSYPCTVGAGGGVGSNGNNSQFSSLTATIGGGKGGYGQGANGGSGGGGSGTNSYGLGTAGQGYNGSDNSGNSYNGWPRGAGGGAGGPGGAVTSNNKGGDGGIGSSAYSSWGLATSTGHNVSGTVYYAGGGGGSTYYGGSGVSASTGGYGGGGNGGLGGAGASGLPNTGGGAGGNDTTNTSVAQGGSGIIIIKYPMA